MALYGLDASFADSENGMIKGDMRACIQVANELDEVIIFRSTGPWSRRWIELRYPTKNFHVKGKSSDWGPQAGFVPYLGKYSKVGHLQEKADAGTKANDKGLTERYASKTQLTLSLEELQLQATQPEESPPRFALSAMEQVSGSKDYFLSAKRSGDGKEFAFRAVSVGTNLFQIFVYDEKMGTDRRKLLFEKGTPLEVMTSGEIGAGNKPMTGDYDLMAVCPRWGNYGSKSVAAIEKPGVAFVGKGAPAGQTFVPGTNLDKVVDMRSNTGAPARGGDMKKTFQGLGPGNVDEHPDMGNITPRILRCIGRLNTAMGAVGSSAPFRRVHHNAESHRHHMFGALTRADMEASEGFPLTVFQPASLLKPSAGGKRQPTSRYDAVATLKTIGEFKEYATLLNEAGYFVPRNWTWGMSIRDRVHSTSWRA